MTVYEYAIAREANRLMLESEIRELTEAESDLLRILVADVERFIKTKALI